MRITVLGTGTNRINLERSSPSYLLEVGKKNILIDTGNGCIRQLLRIKKNILDVDAVLYTHFHKDHYLELPDIINQLKAQRNYPQIGKYPNKKIKKITIFGPNGVEKVVSLWKGDLNIKIKTLNKSEFTLFGLKIKTLPLLHLGYIIGYRFIQKGKVITYTSDSRYCTNSVKLAKNADVLIHSVGLPKKYGAEKAHPLPLEAGKVASEAGVKKLVLTHFYPAVEKYSYQREVREYYRGTIVIAKDLMKIKV